MRALGFLLMGCLSLAAATPRKVVLKLNWHHQFQFAGYYAAQRQGYYRDAGLEVEFQVPRVNEDPAFAVLDGKADFGIGGPDLLQHWGQGRPVVVLAAIFQHTPQVILARPESGIQSIHDLRGKRVMIESQAASLRAYLKAESLAGSLKELPHNFGVEEFARGEVDALSAYLTDEPFELKRLGQPYLVFTPQAAGFDFYGDCLFTRRELIQREGPMVEAFRKASLAGWRYAMTHPEELVAWILDQYGSRHSAAQLHFEAETMRPLLQTELVEMGYLNPGRWQHISRSMADLGMVAQGLELEGFLYDPNPRSAFLKLQRMLMGAVLVALGAAVLSFLFLRLNRRLREQIRRNEEIQTRFQSLLQHTTDSVFWIHRTAQGKFIIEDINPAQARSLGLEVEAVRGRPLEEVVDPDLTTLVEPRYQACLDTGMPQSYEESFPLGGVLHTFETLLIPLPDHAGQFSRLVGFSRDVTLLRQDQEQRRQGQKMDSLVLMAGGIAHDFNNLFQAAQGNLEMARITLQRQGISVPSLDRVEGALTQAAALSGALLNFSGKGFRTLELTDLVTLTREKIQELEAEDPLQNTLQATLPEGLPPVELDRDQMGKVILALVTNALEAVGDRRHPGAVGLRIHPSPPPEPSGGFWVAPRPAVACLCLEIEDDGPGIPREVQTRIFEPFFSTKRTGRGLGLPATLGILKAHAAGLYLASHPNEGTRVLVYVPIHRGAPDPLVLGASALPAIRGAILVVDDEPTVRETLTELLREVLGFTVIPAADGIEAVELFERHASEIALVLMDATMPRMGGMEAFAALRARRADLPGILCSGYGEEFGQQTAASHGFHSFLKKPFLIKDLEQAIARALESTATP